jgi:iron complex transport system ATP-binding protein
MTSIVEFDRVTLERSQRRILDHITWQIRPGEQWVLLGPNGSGKTSLLTLLMGYEWPTDGRITVLGHSYGRVDLRDVRKALGWVSQHLADWMTRDHGHEQVQDIVKSGIDATIGRGLQPLPAGDTRAILELFDLTRLAQSPFRALSQGEKTRALLARAWMADARLLILDEPCSGLDIAGREHFLTILNHIMHSGEKAVTVIYVTHHAEEILPLFSHALILKEGQILAQGSIASTLTSAHLSRAIDLPLVIHTRNGRRWVEVMELEAEPSLKSGKLQPPRKPSC